MLMKWFSRSLMLVLCRLCIVHRCGTMALSHLRHNSHHSMVINRLFDIGSQHYTKCIADSFACWCPMYVRTYVSMSKRLCSLLLCSAAGRQRGPGGRAETGAAAVEGEGHEGELVCTLCRRITPLLPLVISPLGINHMILQQPCLACGVRDV